MINQEHVGKHLKDHANFRIEFDCIGFDTLNQKTWVENYFSNLSNISLQKFDL